MIDNQKTQQVKIGLVGCGRWGKNILRDLLLLGAQVHVAELRAENCAEAQKAGAASAHTDMALLPPDLDAYVVAVQTGYHYAVLKQLADMQKPVFVEKPLSPNRAHAIEIQKLMGDRVFVMHKWRYHPGIEKMASLRKSGMYGRLKTISTYRTQWDQPHTDVDAFWILAPHDVSIIFHILGYLPPVTAVQATVSGDSIHAMTAFLGASVDTRAQITISDYSPVINRLITLHFETAIVSLLDPLADHIEVRHLDVIGQPTARIETFAISTEFPLLRELSVFIAYVKNGVDKPMSTIDDELVIMDTLNHLRTAALAQGQR